LAHPCIFFFSCCSFVRSPSFRYEGTGRSLSLKLINDLRKRQGQANHDAAAAAADAVVGAKSNKVTPGERVTPARVSGRFGLDESVGLEGTGVDIEM
jgi:hypothetical protein